jgi:hypothetical protein
MRKRCAAFLLADGNTHSVSMPAIGATGRSCKGGDRVSDWPGRHLPYQGLPIAANSAPGDHGEPAPSISDRQTPPPGADMARRPGERNRPRDGALHPPGVRIGKSARTASRDRGGTTGGRIVRRATASGGPLSHMRPSTRPMSCTPAARNVSSCIGSTSPTPSPSQTRPRPTGASTTRSAPHESLDFATPISRYLADPLESHLFEPESVQDS